MGRRGQHRRRAADFDAGGDRSSGGDLRSDGDRAHAGGGRGRPAHRRRHERCGRGLRLPAGDLTRGGPSSDGRMGTRPRGGTAMSSGWPPAPPPVDSSGELPPAPVQPPVKVLHVITRFIAGAGGNTLLSALGTDREHYEPWITGGLGDIEARPLWERAERSGVRTVKLRRLSEPIAPLDDLVSFVELFRLIRRERFAVVHTHSTKGGILGRLAAWLGGTPVIVHTIHGFSTHEFMSARRRLAYLAIERAVRPITDRSEERRVGKEC